MKYVFSVLTILGLLSSKPVYAFPELVRKGYNNCMVCHASPTGGGVLTEYGRALSKEELSTWGSEGEENFLHGAVELPDWLMVGGDIRFLQYYRDSPRVESARAILMQADIEMAASFNKFLVAASVGREELNKPKNFKDRFISRRHYVGYQATENVMVRGGRFFPAIGIKTPDHAIVTKRGLGWDQGTETYNLEASWIDEQFNFYLTGMFGRPDKENLDRNKGVALTGAYYLADGYKLGLSYWHANSLNRARHVVGPWGILGFTPHFFLLSEIDFQREKQDGREAFTGMVNYNRLNYEWFQGFHTYITQEYSRLDFKDADALIEAYGIGVQWFPRPHFEINLSYQKQRMKAVFPNQFIDFAWLLLHYYL